MIMQKVAVIEKMQEVLDSHAICQVITWEEIKAKLHIERGLKQNQLE